MTLSELFKSIADAIRSKDGTSDSIPATDFASRISAIETQPTIESLTATENGTYTASDGIDGYSPVTVAIPTVEQGVPTISVDADGVINSSVYQEAGLVSEGTKQATKALTVYGPMDITPSTTSQIAVPKNVYTLRDAVVKGDSNLVASNIKSGVSIFGVKGSYTGGGGNVSAYNMTATGTGTSSLSCTGDVTILSSLYNNGSFYVDVVATTYPGNSAGAMIALRLTSPYVDTSSALATLCISTNGTLVTTGTQAFASISNGTVTINMVQQGLPMVFTSGITYSVTVIKK